MKLEKRVDLIEKQILRLFRRRKKKTSIVAHPHTISIASFGEDVRGDILNYMFPCGGALSKCIVDVGKLKIDAVVRIRIEKPLGYSAESYVIDKSTLIIPLDIKINSGDKLLVSVFPESEKNLTEAWVSLLWAPYLDEGQIKSFLIDDLLEDNIEGI